MKLGLVVDGHRGFIGELLADWQSHYKTEEFAFQELTLPISQGRINQWLSKRALQHFINSNDLVFFEWAGPLLITASKLESSARIVTRLHSFELYEYAPHIEWRSVDRVILVSYAMQQRFNELYPEHAAKTSVIYHGKPLDKFKPAQHKFSGQISMLGNLTPIKRVYEMILTTYALRQKGYDVHLHLGGEPRDGAMDQRYFASIKSAVKKLDLQKHITFHGYVPEPENWLRGMDIFVSNSYWEGQQNALIEAMATGCYCLSHFWDGAEELLPVDHLYSTDSELQKRVITFYEMSEEEKCQHRSHMRTLTEKKFDLEVAKQAVRMTLEEVYLGGN